MNPQELLTKYWADGAQRADVARIYSKWITDGGYRGEVIVRSRQTDRVTMLGTVLRLSKRTGRLLVRTYAADGSVWTMWRRVIEVVRVPDESTCAINWTTIHAVALRGL